MKMPWRRASQFSSQRPTLTDEFRSALAREMLRTELLRAKVLLITVSLLMAIFTTSYWIFPSAIEKIWRGQFSLAPLLLSYAPLLVFEVSIIAMLRRRLAQGRDVPHAGRYLGVLIETSLPTVGLYLQMNSMGPNQALAFAVPFAYFIFIILSTLWLDFRLSLFTGFVAAAELFAIAMLYHPPGFDHEPPPDLAFHLIRSLVLLTSGVLAGGVGMQLRRQFETSISAAGARDRITSLFGQHVSPQVVEQLLAAGTQVTGETRTVVVMFVDFRNFTGAARLRSPEEVVARLDDAFAVLVDILERHGGIVNKFLGDGFLALFGAPIADPRAALCAVAAAREMLAAMQDNNAGQDWPLRIGIGIHIGDAVVGTVGSPRRKEYTVIGDTVNFASRLESLNKDFDTQLLISSAIRDEVGADAGDARLLGSVTMRGYAEPMAVWKLG
ncbi:adenylate/guanylate cyclase domain-containing protein [Rhodopseudomonas palustris]|uniref:adenylate/guanylate cyclase domain-containing protein n=1 Tax=Rhodopseudomonas palustris TaxID=1076 RepID=UPI002ACE1A16|nr:adenylate/guanylate cyclase domain-containing protein [Rhodopseudomonas palustris]WQH01724.1 adenylate/guanylate cyclase domain-containing protein [Rhodopseudomonas palustris]